ncbi:hypothetical protein QTO01_01445 [Vibrio mytili]|uniref:Phage holin family protein n=1 Tax=Vibrio mytili TaxID=50718 RepID=A0A0C3I6L1_9VIBR|nr:hypothetical protein [Vibrio mytili]KIN10660.1 hypothetical protein SU60_12150 [Vibrio mytili]
MSNSGPVPHQQQSDPRQDTQPGSTTGDCGRDPNGAEEQDIQQTINGLNSIFSQLDTLTQSLKAWSGSTLELFLLEVKVNASAVQQLLLSAVIFTLLSVLFVFSLCLASGVVAYQLTLNVYIAVLVFITSLALALFALAWWQKRLVGFLGFKNTTEQLQEGWDALAKKAQSSRED